MAMREESNQEKESNRKKFSNWLQCVNSLNETKTSLHDHVLEIWKKEIMSWDKDLREHLPRFLICVSEDKMSYKVDKKEKRERKRERYCKCEHAHCNKILKNLLSIHQNPGSRIIWNNELCKQLAQEKLEIEPDSDNDDDDENIPRVETSILALFLQMLFAFIGLTPRKQNAPTKVMPEVINYEDIFDGCKQEHIWCIANMFMHHGKNENKISNTGPGNTDASMFFRMMQNCKLFEIEDQNNLYEEILSCRNRLHHSANNRVSQKDAETHLDTMITFLNQFEQVPKCKDAIQNIEKMLKETILSVSMPDKTLRELSEKALQLKKSALEVDGEIDRSSGFTSDETNGLLETTKKELQKISDQPSGEISNVTESEDVEVQSPDVEADDDSELLKSHTQLRSDPGVSSAQTTLNNSHVWSVESEQSYTIKVEGDRKDCDITGCCMLPTGEFLLADFGNSRLKKFNDRYQVISVCNLPDNPLDVCYCGNNEAVLAMFSDSLQFVDVTGGMSLIRKVRTDHHCDSLTCHGNQLYVIDDCSVYIYSTDGIKQCVLYTHHSGGTLLWRIAVSDDGSYIYITDNTRLHTIDSVGNHLYTFTDIELNSSHGICIDGEDHVFVSEVGSNKVMQISYDGKQKLGITVSNISNEVSSPTIYFNRSNATLIVAGISDKIHVLKLK